MPFRRISRVTTLALGISAVVFVASPAAFAQSQAGPTGVWIDHTGRGAVEIYTCGSQICGRIAWLKEPNDAKGVPMKDKKGRPLCGLQIIGDLKSRSKDLLEGGWIYDPDKNETFNVEITVKGADRLQVLGYMGVKFLSETYMWKRAPDTFTVCTGARPS